ncbi:MAG: hypothetical protein P4L99_18870 [Chthoniobacter sp.]|nr:hypothetical protein [Chthoniobacter sp.]
MNTNSTDAETRELGAPNPILSCARAFPVFLLVFAVLLGPVSHLARAAGYEPTADWKAEQKWQGHVVHLFARPIPNGSELGIDFAAGADEDLSIGFNNVDLEAYDNRGDKIPLRPLSGGSDTWGTLNINSLGKSYTACYEMTLKKDRHLPTARLIFRGEKCVFNFAVSRN